MHTACMEIMDDERLLRRAATEVENAGCFFMLFDEIIAPQLGFMSSADDLLQVVYAPSQLRRHFVLSLGRHIIGIADVHLDDQTNRSLSVTSFRVEDAYKVQGYERALVEAIYQYACERNFIIVTCGFTPLGKARIESIFAELNLKLPQALRSN